MTDHRNKEILAKACFEVGVNLSQLQIEQLAEFIHQILFFGKNMNLTGYKTFPDIARMLVADSLSIIPHLDLTIPKSVLDIGAGAGFPSIPLAILLSQNWKFFLIEQKWRKAAFLRLMKVKLKLINVEIIEAKAEEAVNFIPSHLNLILLKAVGSLEKCLKLASPYMQKQTLAVLYKGKEILKESYFSIIGKNSDSLLSKDTCKLNETLIEKYGFKIDKVVSVQTSFLKSPHFLLFLSKL